MKLWMLPAVLTVLCLVNTVLLFKVQPVLSVASIMLATINFVGMLDQLKRGK